MSSPTVASSGRSNLPPQLLVLNLRATGPSSLRAKIGPVSRSQIRRNAPERSPLHPQRGTSGGFSLGAIDQQPHAVSSESARTMAATSRRGASRSPYQAAGLAGQAVQIAFCGAHSGASEIGLSVTEIVMSPLLWVAGSANQAASAGNNGGLLAGPGVECGEAVIGRNEPEVVGWRFGDGAYLFLRRSVWQLTTSLAPIAAPPFPAAMSQNP